MRVRGTVPLLIPAMLVLVGADYQSDRQWDDLRGGRAAMQIERLYLGQRQHNACLGNAVARCARAHERVERDGSDADGAERWIVYGKKILYRGTGAENVAVGPERREIAVRDGKVIREIEVVQVVENGSPWVEGDTRQMCESWGAKNTSSCIGVTPYGPVPAAPDGSNPPYDFGCPAGERAPAVGDRLGKIEDADALAKRVVAAIGRVVGDDVHVVVGSAWPVDLPSSPRFMLGQDPRASSPEDPGLVRECARSVHARLVHEANERGHVMVGVCDRADELTWEDVCEARRRLTTILLLLGSPYDPAAFAAMGLPPRSARRAGGIRVDGFPVILVGHGFGVLETAVVTREGFRPSVVVQFYDEQLCRWAPAIPLCRDRRGAIDEVGTRLARALLVD